MDGTNINESSFDWLFNTIDRLKSGDIRPIDVFTFFCIFLLFDLIRKSKRPKESLIGIAVSSIYYLIKIKIESKHLISQTTTNTQRNENKTEIEKKSNITIKKEQNGEQNTKRNVIKELLENHYVFNKVQNFGTYLIDEIKYCLKFWTDRKIPLKYSGITKNCFEDIIQEKQILFQELFGTITNEHLTQINDKISTYRMNIKVDEGQQKIKYKKTYFDDTIRIIDGEINDYFVKISKIILNDPKMKNNIIFYNSIKSIMENLKRLLTLLKLQIKDQIIPEDSGQSFIDFEWVIRKYFDYFYVQLEFLIVMISNDIKKDLFQEITLDKELEKLVSILKNESIEIVKSIDEMLQLEDISQFQIVIIDSESGNNLSKSYINFTGRNTRINDWTELKSFLQSIDLEILYDTYNKE